MLDGHPWIRSVAQVRRPQLPCAHAAVDSRMVTTSRLLSNFVPKRSGCRVWVEFVR